MSRCPDQIFCGGKNLGRGRFSLVAPNMILKTKRLILRKPRLSDWKDIVEGAGEYDVAKTTASIPYPYKKKDAMSFIKDSIKNWSKREYTFFIELKVEKKVIGAMSIGGINRFIGVAETGSWINKKYWRQGFITEAKIAANDFAFNKLKLRRLYSPVYKDNQASNATQKKMGYKFEGRQRKAGRSKSSGQIHDVNIYGLLKEDWIKIRQKIIKSIVKKV